MKFYLFLATLIFASCSTLPEASQSLKDEAYSDSQKGDNYARLYIVRTERLIGSAVAFPIYINGRFSVNLNANTFTMIKVAEGDYNLSTPASGSKIRGSDKMKNIKARNGESYFVEAYASLGVFSHTVNYRNLKKNSKGEIELPEDMIQPNMEYVSN